MCIYEMEKIGTVLLDCLETVVSDGRLWMVGMESQVVFSADYSFREIVPEYVIDKYADYLQDDAYHYMRKRGSELFLFPGIGKFLRVVNCETGEVHNVSLLRENWDYKYYYTQDVIEYDGAYYIFPAYFSNPLLRFDGKEIQECAGWIENMQKFAGYAADSLTESVIYDGGKVWLPLHGTNRLVCTTLKDMHVECYDVPIDGCLDIMQKQGDLFWITPFGKGNIIVWSAEKGIVKEYGNLPSKRGFSEQYAFMRVICREDSVWFLPWVADGILVLDLNTDRFEVIELPEGFSRKEEGTFLPKCSAYAVKENRLILPACGSTQHLIIDMDKKQIICKINAELPGKDYEQIYRQLQKRYYGAREFFYDALINWHLPERGENECRKETVNSGTCGGKIWRLLLTLTIVMCLMLQ